MAIFARTPAEGHDRAIRKAEPAPLPTLVARLQPAAKSRLQCEHGPAATGARRNWAKRRAFGQG
jgi:hypothetical protein